jgi:hypothetical protein
VSQNATPSPRVETDFTLLLLLTIELLKKGAPMVDVHHWGLRIRVLDGSWSVGPIPADVRIEHSRMLLAGIVNSNTTPIDGEGETDGGEAPRVGTAT